MIRVICVIIRGKSRQVYRLELEVNMVSVKDKWIKSQIRIRNTKMLEYPKPFVNVPPPFRSALQGIF